MKPITTLNKHRFLRVIKAWRVFKVTITLILKGNGSVLGANDK